MLKKIKNLSGFGAHIAIGRVGLGSNIVFDLEFLNSLFGKISVIASDFSFRIDIRILRKKDLEVFDIGMRETGIEIVRKRY